MAGFPWLRFVEAWMVQQLLRTPAFHRAVEKVARGVHRARHGIPPEELGGTKIDSPGQSTFIKNFTDEVRTQLGVAEREAASGNKVVGVKGSPKSGTQAGSVIEEENADAAWQNAQRATSEPPKQGFMAEYMDALRDQIRGQTGRK